MAKKNHKANIRSLFWLSSSGLKSTADSIMSPFLPLYGIELGASPTLIGLLVSITSLLSIVQIGWAKLADKLKNTRIIAIISNYLSSIFNFIFATFRNLAFFVSFRGTQSLISSASLPTSSAILAERTQTKDWPYWNGLIQTFLVIGSLIGILLGGFLLTRFSEELGYIVIFIFAGVISLFSAIMFHLAVPKKRVLEKRKRWYQVEEVSITLDNILAVMKSDKNFIKLSIASFIFIFGVNFSAPFYIVYNIHDYSLTIFEASLLTSIGLVPQIIFSLLTSKFIERIRTKEVLIMGGLITSFFPIVFFLPSILNWTQNIFVVLVIIWIVNGIAWGIINPSLSTLTLDVIHPRRRTLQLAISNSLNAIALFIAPVLGGLAIPQFLLNGDSPSQTDFIYLIFIISAIVRLVGSLFFIIVQEPIIGGTILRPINKIFSTPIRTNAEKIVSTIIATPFHINKRRKSTKTYGKDKTT
ncbi:MAG: MFS transporter [Candidatus Thorarchaeota archaeon]